MKRFLLLLALIATTGGALAHNEDPQLAELFANARTRTIGN